MAEQVAAVAKVTAVETPLDQMPLDDIETWKRFHMEAQARYDHLTERYYKLERKAQAMVKALSAPDATAPKAILAKALLDA